MKPRFRPIIFSEKIFDFLPSGTHHQNPKKPRKNVSVLFLVVQSSGENVGKRQSRVSTSASV
jgi:hypothetical protein